VHYVRIQSSGSAPKTIWYDLVDREIKTDAIGFDGRTVSNHMVYNNRGEMTHASLPYFSGESPLYSTMNYDVVGRQVQQTAPGNRVQRTTYDGLTTIAEQNYDPAALQSFQKSLTVTNVMGWTVQSSQYLGTSAKTINRKYDPVGNLRFVIDPASNTTEIRYDIAGNKTWMSEPNSGISTFAYNALGELTIQTNAAAETVLLTYDKLGRVLTRTEPEGITRFDYDNAANGVGQIARESNGIFSRTYRYDQLSRPAASIESHGLENFAISRSYDSMGRPDSTTYPTGFATRQIYNANGHLSEVRNAANSQLYWRAVALNSRAQITQESLGNGIVTSRAFDANSGLISGITSTGTGNTSVQRLEFDFDLIANLTERRDKRFTTEFVEGFTYDTLNRLKTVTTTDFTPVVASYNDIGNLTGRSDIGAFNYSRTGNAGPHALTSVSSSLPGMSRVCTTNIKGNRITDGDTTIAYTSFNKPMRIAKGGDTLRFDYAADRSLFRQTAFLVQTEGSISQTVREYVGGIYERETNNQGLVRHIHYIAGGSGVVAIQTNERSGVTAAQRTRYIHKDHLGSVDAITDSAGSVVERQSFDAWGRRRNVEFNAGSWKVTYPSTPGSAETHRGFTGHEMLDAVGLVHMGGRIYDPISARFLSPDPYVQAPDNLQNLNRYSYVLNNPLSFTDPSGFFFKGLFKSLTKMVIQHVVGTFVGTITGAVAYLASGLNPIALAYGFKFGYGFGSSFTGALLAGGSCGDALRAGLYGGLSAGAAYGVGSAFNSPALARYSAFKPIVHGLTQGGIRSAQGGKFAHGFLSGTFASQFSETADSAERAAGTLWAGRAVAAIVGGTAEAIGGGKFGNGAVTGAFVRMFNDEGHRGASVGKNSEPSWWDRQMLAGGMWFSKAFNLTAEDAHAIARAGGQMETWGAGAQHGIVHNTVGMIDDFLMTDYAGQVDRAFGLDQFDQSSLAFRGGHTFGAFVAADLQFITSRGGITIVNQLRNFFKAPAPKRFNWPRDDIQ
jgi:RHS repeat-associated protein